MKIAYSTTAQRIQVFSFRSELQSIQTLELLLDEVKEQLAIPEEIFRTIWVCVNEAISNSILHGNRCDPMKKVILIMEMKGDNVCFIVSDEGQGFDPESVPDPTEPSRLLEPHGRGVFLMKKLADSLKYTCKGTVAEMCFLLNK